MTRVRSLGSAVVTCGRVLWSPTQTRGFPLGNLVSSHINDPFGLISKLMFNGSVVGLEVVLHNYSLLIDMFVLNSLLGKGKWPY